MSRPTKSVIGSPAENLRVTSSLRLWRNTSPSMASTASAQPDTGYLMDITKLQRIVVDALEDVKAQDIKVLTRRILRACLTASSSPRPHRTAKPARSLQAFRIKLAKQVALLSPPKARKLENGCWLILVTLLCTSCSQPSASITTSKKFGVARRSA